MSCKLNEYRITNVMEEEVKLGTRQRAFWDCAKHYGIFRGKKKVCVCVGGGVSKQIKINNHERVKGKRHTKVLLMAQ